MAKERTASDATDPLSALSSELDALLIDSVRKYRRGLTTQTINPGDIKAPLLAQVRNRIKDLWAMSKASTGDEANDLLAKATEIANSLNSTDEDEA